MKKNLMRRPQIGQTYFCLLSYNVCVHFLFYFLNSVCFDACLNITRMVISINVVSCFRGSDYDERDVCQADGVCARKHVQLVLVESGRDDGWY